MPKTSTLKSPRLNKTLWRCGTGDPFGLSFAGCSESTQGCANRSVLFVLNARWQVSHLQSFCFAFSPDLSLCFALGLPSHPSSRQTRCFPSKSALQLWGVHPSLADQIALVSLLCKWSTILYCLSSWIKLALPAFFSNLWMLTTMSIRKWYGRTNNRLSFHLHLLLELG